MKRFFFLLFALAGLYTTGNAQKQPHKTYWTTGGELIFAFNNAKDSGAAVDRGMRFSFFFHLSHRFHIDFNKHTGFSAGAGIRNIGFVTKNEEAPNTRIMRRSYNLGIPVMLKLGDMDRDRYFFVGAEGELLFHYKEKFCVGRDRVAKNTEWFSDKTQRFMPSVFAGYQPSAGISFKMQVYLANFMNQDYTEKVNNVLVQPYRNFESPVFFFSISSNTRDVFRRRRKESKEAPKTTPLPEARALRFGK